MIVHYNASQFKTDSLELAKMLTVGDIGFDDGEILKGQDRWESDTRYTIDFISERFKITEDSFILDYGCGTGRIAKGLIERFGCIVIGCDESDSMKRVALDYVNSDRFGVCFPHQLQMNKRKFDFAYSLWVLQHVYQPDKVIDNIYNSMALKSQLLVFNENIRLIPLIEYPNQFVNDQIDIKGLLKDKFGNVVYGKLDPTSQGTTLVQKFVDRTFWGIYERT